MFLKLLVKKKIPPPSIECAKILSLSCEVKEVNPRKSLV